MRSYLGRNATTARRCTVQQRRFRWDVPLTYGGYRARHCFFATDTCGDDPACSVRRPVPLCIDFAVARFGPQLLLSC